MSFSQEASLAAVRRLGEIAATVGAAFGVFVVVESLLMEVDHWL